LGERRCVDDGMLRNWAVVYFGNFIGAVGLVVLVFLSHHLDMNGGRVGCRYSIRLSPRSNPTL
jgi:formate/nitrite transporter FocA (FNT family)